MNKNLIKLTENDLRNLVKESVNRVLNEIGDTPNGQRALGAVAARSIHRYYDALGDDDPEGAEYWDNVANDAARIGHNNVQPEWEDLPNGDAQYFDNGMEYWEKNLKKYESKNINKKLFKLTESDLHNIIKESVNKLLREGLYDPDDDNEIFDTGFGGQYKISWEFKVSNIGYDYKTVSEGEKIVETEKEAFNFAKKLAKKYKRAYATLFKIEKLIKTLSDDRWETVYDMSNGYTDVVEPNIKEGVEFQSNDPVEEWGYYQNKLQNEFDELGVLVLNKVPKNDPDRMIIQRYISMLQNHLHKLEKQF